MLRKIAYFVLAELAVCAGGYGMTLHFPDWSSAIWFGIAGASILAIVAIGLHERWQRQAPGGDPMPSTSDDDEDDFRSFDVPIRDAVNHLVETNTHTFNSSGGAERYAFEALYKEMCAGRLSVIGMKGDFDAPERISACKCKKLRTDVVLSPNGVIFSLIDQSKVPKPLVEFRGPPGFIGLRVRSEDLYGIWPRNNL